MPSLFRRTLSPEITELRDTVASLQAQITEGERMTLASSRTSVMSQRSAILGGGAAAQSQVLYDCYLQTPWLSAPIDTIAKRITSGGLALEPARKGADRAQHDRAMNLFLYCNDEDDIVQLCQNAIVGMLIFGAGLWEVVLTSGIPTALYLADPVTVQPETDERGEVVRYVQKLPGGGDPVTLDPEQIVRFALRGPRGEVLSPVQKLFTSSVVYQRMMRWSQKFFEHGAKAPATLELPEKSNEAVAARQQAWLEENYTGVENAHSIPVLWGGAKLTPLAGSGAVEMDFLNSIKYVREEFLAVLGVPPAMIAISDDGNRLADVSQSADKTFRNNTINPIRRLIEEKITYRILRQGMGITDWVVKLNEADYEDDKTLVDLVVAQVNAGIMTRDSANAALGRPQKIGTGGNVPSITLSREVVPVADLATIHGAQFQAAQQAAMTTGLVPDTKPEDLANASPRDPLSTGADHPVAARDAHAQGQGDGGNAEKPTAKEAREDLARWQRLVLKARADGTTPRAFVSSAIDPITYFALAETLDACPDAESVRSAFDVAFHALRD